MNLFKEKWAYDSKEEVPLRAQGPQPPQLQPSDYRRQSVAAVYHHLDSSNDQLPRSFHSHFDIPEEVEHPEVLKFKPFTGEMPIPTPRDKVKRISTDGQQVTPFLGLTLHLVDTYSMCVPNYNYKSSRNPRRVLTKNNQPVYNNEYDNELYDYILYVNDTLGVDEKRMYVVLDILGQGTFGQVVKCQDMKTGEIVAVKVVKAKLEFLKQSIMEANILEVINNKVDPSKKHYFVQLKDKFMHKNHLCLVFELLSLNLYELVKQNNHHGLSISLIKTFTLQILEALCTLKDNGIIHCDLKPENILLCSLNVPNLKVIDFGSACKENETLYTYIQSRFYRSPEVILGVQYGPAVDMWSLGCIVAELFLGLPLLPGVSEFLQFSRMVDMFGMPPSWMMADNKSETYVYKFRGDDGRWHYRLKTIEEFNMEYNARETRGKQYFSDQFLPDIIRNYQWDGAQGDPLGVQAEMVNRDCLCHFLLGVLKLSPLERWTPHEALLHPFITGETWTGRWTPPVLNFAASKKERSKSMV